jgi:hypothetical protein
MGNTKIAYEEAPARREDQPPLPMRGRLHSDSHATIFGLSLAVVLAASLVLNAVSASTRICQQPDRDFGATSGSSISSSRRIGPALESGLPVDALGTIRSKACATNQGGEEPGY